MDGIVTTSPRSNERLLWICIAGSMLLHALVVWQVHGVKPAPPPVTQIKATIRPPAPPAPPPAAAPEPKPVLPEPPKPEPRKETPPEPPKPVAKPTVPEVKPVPKTAESKPAPTVAPQPTPTPPTPAETKPAPAPDAPAFRTPAPTAPSAPSAPSAANANSADMDLRSLVRSYQEQLKVQTERYKRYPNEAMQQAWEGTATVMVHVGTDGNIASMDVTQTSGHDMLDEQARIAVGKAKPMVRVPEGLKGKAFDAAVRVIFTLKKEEK